jgi:O-antigen/teichoic acid export membrane protein
MSSSKHTSRIIAINTGSRYTATFTGMAVMFFLTPFLIRTLGKELLGLQTLAWQALQFVGILGTSLSISYSRSATTHYSRGEYAEMNEDLGTGFWFSVVTGTIFAIGTVVVAIFAQPFFSLSDRLVPVARMVILITGLSTSLSILNDVWLSPLYIAQRFFWREIGNIIAVVGSAVAVLIAFKAGHPSIIVWAVLSNGFRLVIGYGLLIPVAQRVIPQFKPNFRLNNIYARCRKLMAFGIFGFIGGLGYLLYYATDSILITNLHELGTPLIVDYNLGQRWGPMVRMLVAGFAGTLTPALTALVATGEHARLHRAVLAATRYSLALALFPCIVLSIYSSPLLATWVGQDFVARSSPILVVTMIGTLMSVPAIVGYEVLVGYGRIGLATMASLIGGVMNILLGIVFVRYLKLGLMGVALASFVTLACRNALFSPILLLHVSKLGTKAYFGEGHLRPILGAVPLALFAFGLRWLWEPHKLWLVFFHFGLCFVIYAASVWFLTFNNTDRNRTQEMANGARRKFRQLFTKAETLA